MRARVARVRSLAVGRVKARLVAGAASRRRSRPTSLVLRVADRHTGRLRRLVERELGERRDDVAIGRLEAAFARGDRSGAVRVALEAFPDDTLEVLSAERPETDCGCVWDGGLRRYCDAHNPVFPTDMRNAAAKARLSAAASEPLAERLLDVMEDSGNATRCAVRPTGPGRDVEFARSLLRRDHDVAGWEGIRLNYYKGVYYTTREFAEAVAARLPGSEVVRWRRGYAIRRDGMLFGPDGWRQ